MPPAGRKGDLANCPACVHGKPCCPHNVTGPATQGSPDVFINYRNAQRLNDPGIHALCCGSNTWKFVKGSPTVFINNRPAVRKGDTTLHCGGIGRLIQGSPDVIIG